MWYYFTFERNYGVLRSSNFCWTIWTLIKINQNWKWKIPNTINPKHNFRETSLVLQLIEELKIKSKTVMRWSSTNKKEGICCIVYFVWRKNFKHLCFISMYSVLNTLSKYAYFYTSKNITLNIFLLVFKIAERLRCIFKSKDVKNK